MILLSLVPIFSREGKIMEAKLFLQTNRTLPPDFGFDAAS